MPFENRNYVKLMSDLVVNETDPKVALAREVINVTPPTGGATLEFAQVVFRAKNADPRAPYAVLASDADLSLDNEYAVVFGDEYDLNESFVPKAIDADFSGNAIAFVRGLIALKDYYIKLIAQDANGANLTDAQFESLKGLLAKQDMIVEKTLVAL